jgi:large subunit ribosomal protein L12
MKQSRQAKEKVEKRDPGKHTNLQRSWCQKMEYVYAALLLHSAGEKITEESVKKVLTAAGTKPEEPRIKALVAALSEIKIEDALKAAQTMQVAAAAVPAEAKKEEKKGGEEEKKKGEEALAGLGALFG